MSHGLCASAAFSAAAVCTRSWTPARPLLASCSTISSASLGESSMTSTRSRRPVIARWAGTSRRAARIPRSDVSVAGEPHTTVRGRVVRLLAGAANGWAGSEPRDLASRSLVDVVRRPPPQAFEHADMRPDVALPRLRKTELAPRLRKRARNDVAGIADGVEQVPGIADIFCEVGPDGLHADADTGCLRFGQDDRPPHGVVSGRRGAHEPAILVVFGRHTRG